MSFTTAALALAFSLVVQAAPAQVPPAQGDWRPLGTSGGGRQTSYDAASITRAGPVTRVRLRFIEGQSYALGTIELRCAAYEARSMGTVTYDPNGVELNRNDMATPFRAIIAGTILETVRAEVCGAAPGRQ